MKKIFTLIILFTSLNLYANISTPTKYIKQDFDVLSYEAYLDLTNYNSVKTNAHTKIRFMWSENKDSSKFYFHLTGLEIDSIYYNDIPILYEKIYNNDEKDYYYQIVRNKNIDKDTNEIHIFYSGTLGYYPSNIGWAGVNLKDSIIYAMGVGFLNPAVSSTRYWLACYDHPSDKATFKGKFLVRKGINVASNGLFKRESLNDTLDLFIYEHNYPVSTYLLTFAAGKFEFIEMNYNNLPIHIFSEKKDTAATKYYYRHLPSIIQTFEQYLGPYPFEKVGYVNTPTGSMEHQTMISLDRNIIRNALKSKDTLSLTSAHELSHQWFGNSTTPLDFRDAWLNEAFATYSEALWLESKLGFNAYLDKISQDVNNYFNVVNYEGVLPLYDFPRTAPSSNYPATIYYKGSSVVAYLRYLLGDSLFFALLKEYLNTYKYKNISTAEFKSFCENFTNIDLSEFFKKWVYSKGYPQITITFDRPITNGVRNASVTINQVQPDDYPIFEFPLSIIFNDYYGNTIEKIFYINEKQQTFSIDTLPPIAFVVANRGTKFRVPLKINYITYSTIENIDEEVKIYPNPAEDYLNVSNNEFVEKIEIFNVIGIKLYEYKNIPSLIEISSLPKGMYFLNIKLKNNQAKVEKLIVK